MGASIWWRRRRSHPRRRDFQSLALLPELLRHFCSLHQLQQAAITKPSSKCQRSIYLENSNGHLDFSSKTATSSFICCELFLTKHIKQLSVDSFHPLFKQTKSKLLQMCSHHAIYTTLLRHFCKLDFNSFSQIAFSQHRDWP